MELSNRLRIGVMGPGQGSTRAYDLAYQVGALIAEQGGILICGGRSGAMEAAARGARDAGGLTVGILPGEDARDANLHIDIPIVTGLGNARNLVNVLTSQAIIAISGSFGTLSEIALALKCGTPVVGLETWAVTPPGGGPSPFQSAATPQEAVDLAFRLAASRG